MRTDKAQRDDRVMVPPHVRCRQFDDEIVILDLAGGNYFALRDAGAKMWHALAAGKTPAQIAASLVGEYEVEPDALLADCLVLVDELLERRLVSKVLS
jgi:hypothetical protein